MIKVPVLQDIAPKPRHSAEKVLIALIALVLLTIGAVALEMLFPGTIKDFVLAASI